MTTRARTWFITKVILTSANNVFRLNETGVGGNGVFNVTVAAGEYWLHYDTSINSSYPSLYKALVDAINLTAVANGYEIQSNSPTLSPQAWGAGLLIGVNAVIAWQIEAGNAAFTMDPAWFGLGEKTYVAALRADSSYSVDSEFSIEGVWRSTGAAIDGIPTEARSRPTKITTYSHDDPDSRFGMIWKRKRQRMLEWQMVPAASLYRYNDQDAYYRLADKGAGDHGGSFEAVWDKLAENEEVIIVHNVDIWDLQVDTHSSELVRLTSTKDMEDMDSVVSVQRANGEYYTLSFDVTIKTSSLPGYQH